jgi:hypothetical protein
VSNSYPTFRLPELPLESMQVGDCIRVPVEDYSFEQIKVRISKMEPTGAVFFFRYIEHAHHTLGRRIS